MDDKIWFKVMPKIRKDADVFVRRNYLNLQDNYVQIVNAKTDMFLSISGQRETIDDYEIGDQKMVRLYFRIDPYISTYERQIYSSGDFFAQIGGIFSFLRAIGGVFVFMFSERLLVSALAGKLYQVYDEKENIQTDGGNKNGNLDKSLTNSKNLNRSSNKIHDSSYINEEENNFFKKNPVRNLFRSTLY